MNPTPPKYALDLSDTIRGADGTPLHRIVALHDFGTVHSGDRGGYIRSHGNLSHHGNCWIFDDAQVSGNATVRGNAQVRNKARVSDHALVSDDALIGGHALICDQAVVAGNATVTANAGILQHAWILGTSEIKDDAVIAADLIVTNHCVGGDTVFNKQSQLGMRDIQDSNAALFTPNGGGRFGSGLFAALFLIVSTIGSVILYDPEPTAPDTTSPAHQAVPHSRAPS